ncbi:MAG: hypothetical protein RLN70_11050, partial [Rhodospirillaceae bacterium]
MRQSSQLLSLRDRLPPTRRALERRINGDIGRFRAVLESEGYYGGYIDATSEESGNTVTVLITVEPGGRYHVGHIQLETYREPNDAEAPILQIRAFRRSLAAIEGRPARAQDVLDAEEIAIAALHDSGFPFAARG